MTTDKKRGLCYDHKTPVKDSGADAKRGVYGSKVNPLWHGVTAAQQLSDWNGATLIYS